MLEELANQMRDEKRQLQLDREAFEREKLALARSRENQENHLDQYMQDYQRQTIALSNQVKALENEKEHLVRSVEEKLSEGWEANQMLIRKIELANKQRALQESAIKRRDYKDIEAEMEDYEPVEEEKSMDGESNPEVKESVQLPVLPVKGKIDYNRMKFGEEENFVAQLTPRAGEDSVNGQHDLEDEGQVQLDARSA